MIDGKGAGRIACTKSGIPSYKCYPEKQPSVLLQYICDHILSVIGKENLGHLTQRSQAFLERIIQVGPHPDDLVLDPFCGCGTAIVGAERLRFRWINNTYLVIDRIERWLRDEFGNELHQYARRGEPRDLPSARPTAQCDLRHFAWWALGLVDAPPAQDKRKGAARGVDGYLYLVDYDSREPKKVVLRVKSGAVSVLSQVRDLRGAMGCEEEALGVLITLESPTEPLRREPLPAGFYQPLRFPGCYYLWLLILTSVEVLTASRVHCTWPAPVAMFKRPECERKRGSAGCCQTG
ncbi:site-specific DNA-methyltransferase [Thermomicrobium sp. CFH 73360]|uniref:DNA methyltransferase n=1 Tax=Thermomicrobium sp. CFH 73360 TaxID=2951987 RepID=UPI0020775498|nr:DNA methyltransferase [Thermomicrobium sp. CFH 73360]MCM8745832.1 site-specific DNA-methyltransferase [Thermomicrobium sp. CFH 73360]